MPDYTATEQRNGTIVYLTEHWNTRYAYQTLFTIFTVEPAHPLG